MRSICTALTAYQAVLLTPILFFAPGKRRWAVLLAAPITVAAFQLFERVTSGALPAQVLAGYMQSYALQTLAMKAKNAVALCGHFAVTLICPIAWVGRQPLREGRFLLLWIAIFFAGALAIFFAGSARYLLPIAAPLAIFASTSRFAVPALAAQSALAIGLAIVNYQHWNAYREIAADIPQARRIFTNAELGFRHYLEARGALPIEKGQAFRSGDMLVLSAYGETPAAPLALIRERQIDSAIPLRIVALGAHSAYSSVAFGLWPFEISRKPLDRVRIVSVVHKAPELAYVKNGTPEAAAHALSGVSAGDQWTYQSASFALRRPAAGHVARAVFYIPPGAEGRSVTLLVDGQVAAQMADVREGVHTIESKPFRAGLAAAATVEIVTDRPFLPPNDQRRLGVLLTEIGFVPVP